MDLELVSSSNPYNRLNRRGPGQFGRTHKRGRGIGHRSLDDGSQARGSEDRGPPETEEAKTWFKITVIKIFMINH